MPPPPSPSARTPPHGSPARTSASRSWWAPAGSSTPAPQGQQVALVQGAGAALSQPVPGWQAGVAYTLTLDDAQRSFHGTNTQSVRVMLDGAALGTITPAGTGYGLYSVGPFTTMSGTHTLRFVRLDLKGGDNTALLDNIQVTP